MESLLNGFEAFQRYYLNWEIIQETFPLLLQTLPLVLELLVLSMVFSFVLGLILSLMRLSRFRPLRWFAGAYVDFFRGLPLLLNLVFVYSGLAIVGAGSGLRFLILPPITAAVVSLSTTYAAYSAEVFRAGIESIHRGQMEAARSLGMTYAQSMRYVVLPQAIKVVIPPLTNEFIALIKDTSLASVISLQELLFTAKEKMGVVANPTPLAVAAVVYVIFTIPLIRLASRLEKKRDRGSKGTKPTDGSVDKPSALVSADIATQLPKGGGVR
ncbi:MAG: amino acid ABC transporter permease [Actinobacteria bacterium]|nr:amino acid ABC transporter permease [Actinomycetota bacterium]